MGLSGTLWPKIRRRLPALVLLALAFLLIWAAFGESFQKLLPMVRRGDKHGIVTYLSDEDEVGGMICVMILSGVQVASVLLPAIAIHVAAGVLYSWWKAFLLCYTGFLAGTMAFISAFVIKTSFRSRPHQRSFLLRGLRGTFPLTSIVFCCPFSETRHKIPCLRTESADFSSARLLGAGCRSCVPVWQGTS